MLGVAWPSMAANLGRPIGALGLVIAASSAGYVVATVLHGRVTRRVALARLLAASLAAMTLGSLAMAAAPLFVILLAGAFLAGLGGGSLDAATNGFVAVTRGPRLLHLVHAGYGSGTTFGPLLVAMALQLATWRLAYVAAAALDLLLLLLVLASLSSWRVEAEPERRAAPRSGMAAALFVGLVLCYVAAEATTGQWSFSVLSVGRGMNAGAASLWVAAFWAAFTVGRLAAGLLVNRVALPPMLLGGLLLAVIGLAWLAADPAGLGAVGLPVAGFGFAPTFSSVVLLTTRVLGPARAPAVIGYQLAASGVGFALASLVAGGLADAIGLEAIPVFLAALTVLLLLAVGATLRRFQPE